MIDITENIIPIPPTATALGFFDGLHLGHMKVVAECFRHGGLCPAMFTFHSDTALPKREKIENLLTNDMKLEKLAEANPNAGMAAKAPLAIVVCGDMNKALEGDAREFWVQDCSAATENILLAATGMGLGSVWTGTYPSKERCAAVTKLLKLPKFLIPLNTIVIGYPDSQVTPKDKWKQENVSYNAYEGEQ